MKNTIYFQKVNLLNSSEYLEFFNLEIIIEKKLTL